VLTRLDRYLLREVVLTSVAVTGVLLVILLSNQLAKVLGQAAQSEFPGGVVLTLSFPRRAARDHLSDWVVWTPGEISTGTTLVKPRPRISSV
jgi:hypothetical protein